MSAHWSLFLEQMRTSKAQCKQWTREADGVRAGEQSRKKEEWKQSQQG